MSMFRSGLLPAWVLAAICPSHLLSAAHAVVCCAEVLYCIGVWPA